MTLMHTVLPVAGVHQFYLLEPEFFLHFCLLGQLPIKDNKMHYQKVKKKGKYSNTPIQHILVFYNQN